MESIFKAALGLLLGWLLLACEQRPVAPALRYSATPPQVSNTTIYRLAVHPLYNPKKLSAAYQPLIDYLNQNLPGTTFELEASRDYQAFEQKFRAREPAFLLPNPWQTLQAIKVGYHVIAMAGDANDFKGIFIVRRDGGISKPADLKGKIVSYPSPTGLAAAIMPQYFLHSKGINIEQDIQNIYVGSQESSILNVYLGQAAAGATWPPPWRLFQKDHPVEATQLKVAWETPSLPLRHLSGTVMDVLYNASVYRDSSDRILGVFAAARDITDLKKLQDEISQLAFFDPLTKLPNRRTLTDRLSQAMAASQRSGYFAALMYLDLDNFKPVNDHYGHAAGDLLLIEVATRLTSCVRQVDTVGRTGGDEFVVILGNLSTDQAKADNKAVEIAENIRSTMSQAFVLTIQQPGRQEQKITHCCTASIGVTLFHGHDASQEDIMKWADTAMYQAKNAGRNRIQFYAPLV